MQRIGVLVTQDAAFYSQCPADERLRLRVFTQFSKPNAEMAHRVQRVGMLFTEDASSDYQRIAPHRFRLRVLAQASKRKPQKLHRF